MKGLVYAAVLFTTALSAALTLIVNPALKDPYLIWPYVALAIVSFICAIALPVFFSDLNKPVDFYDQARMEGKQQPTYVKNADADADYEKSGSVDGVHQSELEKRHA